MIHLVRDVSRSGCTHAPVSRSAPGALAISWPAGPHKRAGGRGAGRSRPPSVPSSLRGGWALASEAALRSSAAGSSSTMSRRCSPRLKRRREVHLLGTPQCRFDPSIERDPLRRKWLSGSQSLIGLAAQLPAPAGHAATGYSTQILALKSFLPQPQSSEHLGYGP